jgi:hypothetical protein
LFVFKNAGLLKSWVGAGAAGATSKVLHGAASFFVAPQYWFLNANQNNVHKIAKKVFWNEKVEANYRKKWFEAKKSKRNSEKSGLKQKKSKRNSEKNVLKRKCRSKITKKEFLVLMRKSWSEIAKKFEAKWSEKKNLFLFCKNKRKLKKSEKGTPPLLEGRILSRWNLGLPKVSI